MTCGWSRPRPSSRLRSRADHPCRRQGPGGDVPSPGEPRRCSVGTVFAACQPRDGHPALRRQFERRRVRLFGGPVRREFDGQGRGRFVRRSHRNFSRRRVPVGAKREAGVPPLAPHGCVLRVLVRHNLTSAVGNPGAIGGANNRHFYIAGPFLNAGGGRRLCASAVPYGARGLSTEDWQRGANRADLVGFIQARPIWLHDVGGTSVIYHNSYYTK